MRLVTAAAVGLSLALTGAGRAAGQTGAQSVLVTADNFVRAETDLYFGNAVREGGFGAFHHVRELAPIDHQLVIRMNRDTLYSMGIFDLDAGPVTVTLPDAGGRFMSMQVISEDHYTSAVNYKPGAYTLTKEKIGTRYVGVAIRTLVDPSKPGDMAAVHKLQDAVKAEQAKAGAFEVPDWDGASQKKVRDALITLGSTVPDSRDMFGDKEQVKPVRHLIGTAVAWGGNPETEAKYLNATPEHNDGKTVYTLTVKDVPVEGFWSISVYNEKGYFEKNDAGVYTVSNLTAKKGPDGSVTVQFGGCDAGVGPDVNCMPITPGWNYIVRLYRPRAEILKGTWVFPAAVAKP